jgi:hypothetical protein
MTDRSGDSAQVLQSWSAPCIACFPKLSADPPELAFRTTTKSAQVSPLPPASATLVSAAGASKQGLVSKLVSQIDTREKDANTTTSAADRKFKSPKATVRKNQSLGKSRLRLLTLRSRSVNRRWTDATFAREMMD